MQPPETEEAKEQKPFVVRTDQFEGPLEKLLSLVEERKLFINEFSLAEVTGEYLQYIKTISQYNMNELTGFVSVAATLILIKSRSLLPSLELTKEEETTIHNLEERLLILQQVREKSAVFKMIYRKQRIFFGIRRLDTTSIYSPDTTLSLARLQEACTRVLHALPKEEVIHPEVTVEKMMSLGEMISLMTERVTETMNLSFRQLAQSQEHATDRGQKIFTIVSFLALLELVREGIVDVLQQEMFSDIAINHLPKEQNI